MKKLLIVVALVLIGWWWFSNSAEAPEEPAPETEMEETAEHMEDAMEEREEKPDAMMADEEVEEDSTMEMEKEAMSEGEFTLTAEATGKQSVSFTWEVPESLAEGAEGYKFARGEEANPTYPSSWWWERGPAHRELVWEGLPEGDAHFRVCIVRDDECAEYSNDVMVTVE